MGDKKHSLHFSELVKAIRKTHEQCAAHAGRAVNARLTLRNWMIGRHISEFENERRRPDGLWRAAAQSSFN